MPLLIPFKALTERYPELLNGDATSAEIHQQVMGIIKMMLSSVPVDDAWYRRQYPDVSAAIDAGDYASAQRHFVDHGYFESRMPCKLSVDEKWYLATNEDVRTGIAVGEIKSGEEHFNLYGYAEGRHPIRIPAFD